MSTLIFDIEADSLTPSVVWCICALDADTGEEFRYGPTRLSEALQDLFPKYEVLVGHNVSAFDLEALRALYGYVHEGTVIDTLVLAKLIFPDIPKGNSLEAWGDRLFTLKQEFNNFTEYSEEMLNYCMNDVRVTTTLYKYIYNIYTTEYSNKECYTIEYNIHKIINQQEKNGIYFDSMKALEYLSILDRDTIMQDSIIREYYIPKVIQGTVVNKPFTQYGSVNKTLIKYLDIYNIPHEYVVGPFTKIDYEVFNANSNDQLKKILLRNGWTPDTWTPGGQPSLSDSSLQNLGDLGRTVILRNRLQHAYSKIQGLVNNIRKDHRISAGANSCATNTSRMRHYLVANIPRPTKNKETGELVHYPQKQGSFFGSELRSLFRAAPGRVLAGYDAKGLELRILAHFINNKDYLEIVAYGDPHKFTQEQTGLPERDDAKTLIYALVYGARDNKIGSIVGGGSKEGAAIRKRLFKAIPGFENLLKRVETAATKGYLIGLDGRRLYVREGKSPLNTLLQGNGAICMKYIAIELDTVWYNIFKHQDGFKVLDMHDESQWEIDPDLKEPYKKLVDEAFVECSTHFALNCPLAADVKFGETWANTH